MPYALYVFDVISDSGLVSKDLEYYFQFILKHSSWPNYGPKVDVLDCVYSAEAAALDIVGTRPVQRWAAA